MKVRPWPAGAMQCASGGHGKIGLCYFCCGNLGHFALSLWPTTHVPSIPDMVHLPCSAFLVSHPALPTAEGLLGSPGSRGLCSESEVLYFTSVNWFVMVLWGWFLLCPLKSFFIAEFRGLSFLLPLICFLATWEYSSNKVVRESQ